MNAPMPGFDRWLTAVFFTSCLGVFACGTETPEPTGNGTGGSGGSSAGSAGRGGAGGRGGASATAGTGGSAATAGTSGATTTGGSTGTGGSAGSGGSGGSGGNSSSGGTSGADAMPGPGPDAGGPASTAWTHSKVITLDTTATGANVTEDVMKYPLSVVLDKTRFDFTQAQANGADIRFFDSTGKALSHEIEVWEREAGVAAVWVLLDVVKGNSKDQSIVMKWGHSSAPDISDSKAVFKREDGFVGVWHLNEDGNVEPGGFKDASSHEAHGTGVGMIPGSRVAARVGKGQHLDNPMGQNTARWISVGGEKATQFNPDKPMTASLWVMGYSYPIYSYETMLSKGDTSWTLQRVRYGSGQGYQSCTRTPGYHLCAYNFSRQPLVTRQWLHVMLVLQEPRQTLYINGQLNATASAGPWNKGAHPLGIGNQTQALGGRRQWDGVVDEVRVMQVPRTAAWAKLEFESQKENPTLLKFGETQIQPN